MSSMRVGHRLDLRGVIRLNRRYREGIGWLFLASLLLLVIVLGVRLWNTVSVHRVQRSGICLYVAAPGGGLEVQDVRIARDELNAQGLWARLREASKKSSHGTLLPPDATLLEAKQEGEVLVLNFSRELARGQYLGSNEEIALVYSIVNTLAQLPDVESVRILIEGDTVESLADHVDLTAPLAPDLTLIVH